MTRTDSSLRIWLFIVTVGIFSTSIIAFIILGIELSVQAHPFQKLTYAAMIGVIVMRRLMDEPFLEKTTDLLELLFLFSFLSLGGALSQYWVAALTRGYHDNVLAAIDARLGFDWVQLYQLSVQHPGLAFVERAAYMTIVSSPPIIIGALTFAGHSRHAERFIAAVAIALVATLSVFYVFPTQSALMYHIGHQKLYSPITDLSYLPVFEALRASAYPVVSTAELRGFVSFPSFHAILAVLLIWASWPVRWLRVIAVPVNLAMLIATPVEGAHYLIDILAGIAVALGAIALVSLRKASAAPGACARSWPAIGRARREDDASMPLPR